MIRTRMIRTRMIGPVRLLPLLLGLLAACTSSTARQAADTLCEFRERPRPSIMLHYDKTSQIYVGEIDVEAFSEDFRSVASAVAKPIESSYRREDRADCRNEATGTWYPCTQVIEIDLSKVEGTRSLITTLLRKYHITQEAVRSIMIIIHPPPIYNMPQFINM